ncbi:MAG: folate-binding protein [Azospirillaceae bacterium]
MASYVLLEDRGVLALGGEDRVEFLQGLTSNDIAAVGPARAIHTAFLTPQGKYLHDFFVVAHGDALLLDCEGSRRADLARRLKVYKLRSRVEIADRTDAWAVAAVFGEGATDALGGGAIAGAAQPFAGGLAFIDPRLADLGGRVILPAERAEEKLSAAGLEAAPREAWEAHRLALGVPDGSRDVEVEKATLLEAGFDELNGIAWKKGCYMGQELTARTKYRGLVKRRLVPVRLDGPPPEPGTEVTRDGKPVGELRSGLATAEGGLALASIRLDALEDAATLDADGIALHPEKPAWATF